MLAAFLPKSEVVDIFGDNLLDDSAHVDGYKELLGIQGIKPLECVGEIEECRAALFALGETWSTDIAVKELVSLVEPPSQVSYERLFSRASPHMIPEEYVAALKSIPVSKPLR